MENAPAARAIMAENHSNSNLESGMQPRRFSDPGVAAMMISLEDALAMFSKWKEESADIVVVAESPFRNSPSGTQKNLRLRWEMSQRVRVSSVAFRERTRQGIVELVGLSGNLSLAMAGCHFSYEDPREAPVDFRKEAETLTVSALGVLYPNADAFFFHELAEAATNEAASPSAL